MSLGMPKLPSLDKSPGHRPS